MPSTNAEILVALKRLEYIEIDRLITELLTLADSNTETVIDKMQTIQELTRLQTTDLVFHTKPIQETVARWLAKNITNERFSDLSFVPVYIASIKMIGYAHSKYGTSLLEELTQHKHDDVKINAYENLLLKADGSQTIKKALQRESWDVRIAILNQAVRNNITLPADILIENLQHGETRLLAITLLNDHINQHQVQQSLYKIILAEGSTSVEKKYAIDAMATAEKIQLSFDINNKSLTDDYYSAVLLIAGTLASGDLEAPDILKLNIEEPSQQQKTKLRIITNTASSWRIDLLGLVATTNDYTDDIRIMAIQALAKIGGLRGTKLLFDIARQDSGRIKNTAIRQLRNQKTDLTRQWLKQTVNNSSVPDESRLMAAYALLPQKDLPIVAILNALDFDHTGNY